MTAFDDMTLDQFEREVIYPRVATVAALDAEIDLMEMLLSHMEGCPHDTAGEALDCIEAMA